MRNKSTFSLLLLILFFAATACRRHQSAQKSVSAQNAVDTAKTKALKNDTLIFKDPELSALVRQTYKYFSIFDTINPVGIQYDITKFRLDKTEMETLQSHYDTPDSSKMWEGFSITEAMSDMISTNLAEILDWKNIDDYDLSLLLKGHLGVAKSPDGRLYVFSFDEKTGGTYHSQTTLVHYHPRDNEMPFKIKNDSVFNRDGYGSIDTINTRQGIKYVMVGQVTGCNTCLGNYVDVVHYEKGGFVTDFSYNVSTREGNDDGPVIDYDAKLHRININYTTNDMAPGCNCGKDGLEGSDGEEFDGKAENVGCVYVFNGHTFVLKKKKVRPAKE
jgi:hypothetical protein